MKFDLIAARKRYDTKDMFAAVAAMPDHLVQGWHGAAGFAARHEASDLNGVVVIGMGGSAIGGDLLAALARSAATVPVCVVRDYTLPAWVGEKTLVIASSYSGGTEETLAAADEALRRQAPVYAVASGGPLLERAQRDAIPYIKLRGGLQPRAAIGYSFSALLRMAATIGLVNVSDQEVDALGAGLRTRGQTLAEPEGTAARMATSLHGRAVVVYTGPGILAPVGVRWRNQIQENAKQLAFGNAFAELNHNEIVGWEKAPESLRDRLAVVLLRDPGDHVQIARRMDATRDLIGKAAGAWLEHSAEGSTDLERMLSTLQLGDFVSVFLALLSEVDPTPVETIERLKAQLAS